MSQVKNLRAMFEQRGDSPPDRGRTPGIPASVSGSESPRPLSRVRTNFIAVVEKDGRVGLRDPSTDSAASLGRRISGASDGSASTTSVLQGKPLSFLDKIESAMLPRTAASPIPSQTSSPPNGLAKSAVITPAALPPTKARTPSPLSKCSSSEPDEPEAKEATPAKNQADVPGEGQSPTASATGSTSAGKAATASNSPNGTAKSTSSSDAKAAPAPAKATVPQAAKPAHGASKESHKAAKSVPKAISTAKANARSVKPSSLKTPTSPPKSLAPKKSAERVTATPKSRASSAGRSAATVSAKKPPVVPILPSNGTALVKPKPKSPTRPLQLPAGLATHTAASATKSSVPRPSLSRMSNHAHPTVARSQSRASMTGPTTAPRLKRQNSTINRPRPSIGPPPKQSARDHPIIKKEKEVDEGFLARMMRPTQASASKTTDKTPVTPPKKQPAAAAKRPAARKDHATTVKKPLGLPIKANSAQTPKATPAPAATSAPEAVEPAAALSEDDTPARESVEGSTTHDERSNASSPAAKEASSNSPTVATAENAVADLASEQAPEVASAPITPAEAADTIIESVEVDETY